jgi:hypothetical protein
VGMGSLERAYKLRASRLAPGQSHAGSVDTDHGSCQHADESGKPEALLRLQGEMPLGSMNTGCDDQMLQWIAGRLLTDGTRTVRLHG